VRCCLLSWEVDGPGPELELKLKPAITVGVKPAVAPRLLSFSSPSLLLPWRVCPLPLFSISLLLQPFAASQVVLVDPSIFKRLRSNRFSPSLLSASILPHASFSLLVLPAAFLFLLFAT
jgi:hypothetical protein